MSNAPTPPPKSVAARRGFPGPVPHQCLSPEPTKVCYDVRPHPLGPIQLSLSTPSGEMIVFLPKENALDLAQGLLQAATGLVMPSLQDAKETNDHKHA